MTRYSPKIEQYMKNYYNTLSENDRRRYAGIEALKLGRGGTTYIAKVLGCSLHTVRKGRSELAQIGQELGKKEGPKTD
jgi:DNA invertase Pin-like site-specific DNA recombinase